jgi:hypothetical protein
MSNPANVAPADPTTQRISRNFWIAIAINFLWINASEIWRYLAIVKPMLHEAYPGRADIAPFDLPTFASWSLWDSWLIVTATGFYWLYMNWAGRGIRQALVSATLLTVTVFGLIWLGVVNMGFVPARFIWIAVPLAWIEQVIAAMIVRWAIGRKTD